MSLRHQSLPPVPEELKKIVRCLYPKGHIYIAFADAFANYLDYQDFVEMYSERGQSAIHPVRIILVMLLGSIEGLSDRQAVAQLRQSILWKYVLRMNIDEGGFDHSVISKFRDRLIAFEAERMLMDKILDFARQSGLLKTSKQRTDATSILSAARMLNRSELIHEHFRLCLEDLTELYPAWLNRIRKQEWGERYELRPFNYKLGKTDKAKEELVKLLGTDAIYLLEKAIEAPHEEIKQLDSILALYRVFEDYFDPDDKGLKLRKKLKPSGDRVGSPHDTDARVGSKRGVPWLGFKKHLTETINDDGPNLITNVLVTQAHINDSLAMEGIHESLIDRNLKPEQHLVDKAYVQADQVTKSSKVDGIDVVAYITTRPSWQSRVKDGLDQSSFVFDYENRRAICPAGKESTNWKRRKSGDGPTDFNVVFSEEQCKSCPLKPQCTKGTSRVLHIKSKPVFEEMNTMRERQNTAEFKKLYAKRSGIEGTISQDVRRTNSRRSRLTGLPKVALMGVIQAMALNIVRIGSHMCGIPKAKTRRTKYQMAFAAGA